MTKYANNVRQCPNCGADIQCNEYGVGQCKKCSKVYEASEGKLDDSLRLTTRQYDGQDVGNELAEYYGYSRYEDRRFVERRENGHILGTLNHGRQERLYGSLVGARKYNLPIPNRLGSIAGVNLVGSVDIANMERDRRFAYIDIYSRGSGYREFKVYITRIGSFRPPRTLL